MASTGFNRLEDKFRLAFAGLGEILGAKKDGRQPPESAGTEQPTSPPRAPSVLHGPQKHPAVVASAGGSIGRILEDLVHFNNNLTPTAKDPAIWWRPLADPSDASADASNDATVACVTFSELNERANFLARCLARALRSHGLAPPLTVCAMMPCCPDRLALELGAMKLGLPVLSLEPGRCDPSPALAAVRPDCVVVGGGARLTDAGPAATLALQFEDLAEAGAALGLSKRDLQDDEAAAVLLGRGFDGSNAASGDPAAFVVETLGGRFITLSQGQLLAAVAWLWDALPWQCHEVLWVGDSCDSVHWRVHALCALLHGIPVVMCSGCPRWEPWLRLLRAHYVTRLVTSPSFLSELLAHTSEQPESRALLQSVETILTLGEPLHPETADEFFRQLGSGRTLGSVYGCAETCGAAAYALFRCPADVQEALRPDASGAGLTLRDAVPNLRLAVTDPRGCVLPEGEIGEVRLVMLGAGGSGGPGATWDGPAALQTGDWGIMTGGRLSSYGRLAAAAGAPAPQLRRQPPPALLLLPALAVQCERLGFGRLHVTAGGGAPSRLLVQPPRRPPRRFTTAPLRRLAASAGFEEIGALAAWSELPRRRLWELPDPAGVRRPAPDTAGDDEASWSESARRLAEAAAAEVAKPRDRRQGSGGGHLGRLLSCPMAQAAGSWESHLPATEARYRLDGPDPIFGSTFRLVDTAGRVAAVVEFECAASSAEAVTAAATAGFDPAAATAALAGASAHGAVLLAVRVRFPSASAASGGGLRFLRLADLTENLLLNCAQQLGCAATVRIADDTITQLLCQELGYRTAAARQTPAFAVNGYRKASGSCSSVSSVSSSAGSGIGSLGFEPTTVSEAHALCRSQVSLMLVRDVPALGPEDAD